VHSTGFAEVSLELAHSIYPLPDGLSASEAALLDVYACAVHAVHLAPPRPMDTVVIQGAGPIGLACVEMYKLGGADKVVVCDVLAGALEAAGRVGADAVIDSAAADVSEAVMDMTGGVGADIVVEAVGGLAPTFSADVRMAARGGKVLVVGMFSRPQSLDAFEAQQKELCILFSNSYGRWDGVPEFGVALAQLAAGRLRPGVYITHTFSLDDIGRAFETADNKRTSAAIKVMVEP
jgi:threonine dehydrogenase-like Zn-dependent dehydrogenase